MRRISEYEYRRLQRNAKQGKGAYNALALIILLGLILFGIVFAGHVLRERRLARERATTAPAPPR